MAGPPLSGEVWIQSTATSMFSDGIAPTRSAPPTTFVTCSFVNRIDVIEISTSTEVDQQQQHVWNFQHCPTGKASRPEHEQSWLR